MKDSLAPEVSKILGSKGKKLSAHEIHVRRAQKGAFIAKHLLRDKDGNHPVDGQRGEAEYALSNADELMSHIKEHLGAEPQEEDD